MQKATFQIGLEKFLWLKKVKNTVPWTYIISEEIVGAFYQQELQKTNQKRIRIKKVIKRKGGKRKGYMPNGKVINNWFNRWIDKKDIIRNILKDIEKNEL